jgi:hypothetical protein
MDTPNHETSPNHPLGVQDPHPEAYSSFRPGRLDEINGKVVHLLEIIT